MLCPILFNSLVQQDMTHIKHWHSSLLRERGVILGCWTLCPAILQSCVPPTTLFDCI